VPDFSFNDIEGRRLDLRDYLGKAVLVVNTASECGFTPQYAKLQELWQRYRDQGLVVLGVPSNDFGAQEPGTEDEIRSFCTTRYRVDFPLTAKQSVIGAEAHPFYRWVAQELGEDAAPKWNFHKYLLDTNGDLSGLWPAAVSPLDLALIDAVRDALSIN
jgi:glutathione peroxidase